jgi:hypothetical protein
MDGIRHDEPLTMGQFAKDPTPCKPEPGSGTMMEELHIRSVPMYVHVGT